MNGAATRRAPSAPVIEGTSLEAAYSENATAPQHLTRGRNRGKSLVRGLSVQVAYAVIDAMLVFAIGSVALWLRFGITLLLGPERQLFDGSAGHTYTGFFILYAALVVMGCANQDLYRTPRDRRVLDESLKVAKAVGVATTLLVLFIFTSGYKDISRLVVLSAGVLNVGALSGWRYFKRQLVLRRVAAGVGISRVLIVGSGRMGTALADFLQKNPHLGYSVCGFLDDKPSSDHRILGSVDDLRHLALTQFVDVLFITLHSDR